MYYRSHSPFSDSKGRSNFSRGLNFNDLGISSFVPQNRSVQRVINTEFSRRDRSRSPSRDISSPVSRVSTPRQAVSPILRHRELGLPSHILSDNLGSSSSWMASDDFSYKKPKTYYDFTSLTPRYNYSIGLKKLQRTDYSDYLRPALQSRPMLKTNYVPRPRTERESVVAPLVRERKLIKFREMSNDILTKVKRKISWDLSEEVSSPLINEIKKNEGSLISDWVKSRESSLNRQGSGERPESPTCMSSRSSEQNTDRMSPRNLLRLQSPRNTITVEKESFPPRKKSLGTRFKTRRKSSLENDSMIADQRQHLSDSTKVLEDSRGNSNQSDNSASEVGRRRRRSASNEQVNTRCRSRTDTANRMHRKSVKYKSPNRQLSEDSSILEIDSNVTIENNSHILTKDISDVVDIKVSKEKSPINVKNLNLLKVETPSKVKEQNPEIIYFSKTNQLNSDTVKNVLLEKPIEKKNAIFNNDAKTDKSFIFKNIKADHAKSMTEKIDSQKLIVSAACNKNQIVGKDPIDISVIKDSTQSKSSEVVLNIDYKETSDPKYDSKSIVTKTFILKECNDITNKISHIYSKTSKSVSTNEQVTLDSQTVTNNKETIPINQSIDTKLSDNLINSVTTSKDSCGTINKGTSDSNKCVANKIDEKCDLKLNSKQLTNRRVLKNQATNIETIANTTKETTSFPSNSMALTNQSNEHNSRKKEYSSQILISDEKALATIVKQHKLQTLKSFKNDKSNLDVIKDTKKFGPKSSQITDDCIFEQNLKPVILKDADKSNKSYVSNPMGKKTKETKKNMQISDSKTPAQNFSQILNSASSVVDTKSNLKSAETEENNRDGIIQIVETIPNCKLKQTKDQEEIIVVCKLPQPKCKQTENKCIENDEPNKNLKSLITINDLSTGNNKILTTRLEQPGKVFLQHSNIPSKLFPVSKTSHSKESSGNNEKCSLKYGLEVNVTHTVILKPKVSTQSGKVDHLKPIPDIVQSTIKIKSGDSISIRSEDAKQCRIETTSANDRIINKIASSDILDGEAKNSTPNNKIPDVVINTKERKLLIESSLHKKVTCKESNNASTSKTNDIPITKPKTPDSNLIKHSKDDEILNAYSKLESSSSKRSVKRAAENIDKLTKQLNAAKDSILSSKIITSKYSIKSSTVPNVILLSSENCSAIGDKEMKSTSLNRNKDLEKKVWPDKKCTNNLDDSQHKFRNKHMEENIELNSQFVDLQTTCQISTSEEKNHQNVTNSDGNLSIQESTHSKLSVDNKLSFETVVRSKVKMEDVKLSHSNGESQIIASGKMKEMIEAPCFSESQREQSKGDKPNISANDQKPDMNSNSYQMRAKLDDFLRKEPKSTAMKKPIKSGVQKLKKDPASPRPTRYGLVIAHNRTTSSSSDDLSNDESCDNSAKDSQKKKIYHSPSSETSATHFSSIEESQLTTHQKKLNFRKYTIDDFVFVKLLGKGSFGKVLLAELKDHDMYFAIKCLKKDVVLEDDDVESTMIERRVLALGTQHPYMCKLYCTFQTQSYLFFVMEYLNGGDLMFHIQNGRFDEDRAMFYAAEIVSALKFLHKRGIIYRDIKLDNVMLDRDGHIRLVDFGMCQCHIYYEECMPLNFCGTPNYIAPEIILGQSYNQSVDWWSFGVLLFEMILGRSPFVGTDEDELFWSICNEEPSYSQFISKEAKDILEKLLLKAPAKRIGMPSSPAGEIKDHAFFRTINWDKLEKKEICPPFRPTVFGASDTRNFDCSFTMDSPTLSLIDLDILQSMDQDQFHGFSYTNPHITG